MRQPGVTFRIPWQRSNKTPLKLECIQTSVTREIPKPSIQIQARLFTIHFFRVLLIGNFPSFNPCCCRCCILYRLYNLSPHFRYLKEGRRGPGYGRVFPLPPTPPSLPTNPNLKTQCARVTSVPQVVNARVTLSAPAGFSSVCVCLCLLLCLFVCVCQWV